MASNSSPPSDFSQQLGYMKRKKGDTIQEHMHMLHSREIKYTQETLFIKRGRVKVNFYSDDKTYLTSRELKTGDVILLASGGHGFEFLEETEMLEVKLRVRKRLRNFSMPSVLK